MYITTATGRQNNCSKYYYYYYYYHHHHHHHHHCGTSNLPNVPSAARTNHLHVTLTKTVAHTEKCVKYFINTKGTGLPTLLVHSIVQCHVTAAQQAVCCIELWGCNTALIHLTLFPQPSVRHIHQLLDVHDGRYKYYQESKTRRFPISACSAITFRCLPEQQWVTRKQRYDEIEGEGKKLKYFAIQCSRFPKTTLFIVRVGRVSFGWKQYVDEYEYGALLAWNWQGRADGNIQRKNCPSATLSTTNRMDLPRIEADALL